MDALESTLTSDLVHVGRPEDQTVEIFVGETLLGSLELDEMPAGWPVPVRGQRLRLELSIVSMVCEPIGGDAA